MPSILNCSQERSRGGAVRERRHEMQHRDRRPLEKLSQASGALEQPQVAQILAVQVQQIKRIHMQLGTAAPTFRLVQKPEVGEPASVRHDDLAIQDSRPRGKALESFSQGRQPFRPILTALCVEANCTPLYHGLQAVSV